MVNLSESRNDMAFIPSYYAGLTLGSSDQKLGTVRIRVSVADGQAWVAAADQAARDATKVGLLFASIVALTAATVHDYSVQLVAENDTFAFPAAEDNVFLFDKLTVGYRAALDRYTITIPARDGTAFEMESNGIDVVLDDADDVADFIAQFEDTALAKNGSAPNVEYIKITQ